MRGVLTILAPFALLPSPLWLQGTRLFPSLRQALSSTLPASLASATVNNASSQYLLSPFRTLVGNVASTVQASSYNPVSIPGNSNIHCTHFIHRKHQPWNEALSLMWHTSRQKPGFCDFKAQPLSSLHSAISCCFPLFLLASASGYQPLHSANFLTTDWSCPVPQCPEGSLATTRPWGSQLTRALQVLSAALTWQVLTRISSLVNTHLLRVAWLFRIHLFLWITCLCITV